MENRSFQISIWRRMGPFVRPFRGRLIAVLLLMLVSAGIDMALPLFQKFAISRFIEAGTLRHIGWFAALYASVIAVQTVIVIVFSRLSMVLEMGIGRDMKAACFTHLQTLSLSYYNQNSVGYLLARVMSDTNRIAGLIAWALVDCFWALMYVLGVFVMMLALNARLAALVLLVVPAMAALTVFFQSRLLRHNRAIRKINAEISGQYNEGIVGARTSKTLVIERQNEAAFAQTTDSMFRRSMTMSRTNNVYISLVMLCSSFVTALVLTRGSLATLSGALELGTLSAFITYAVSIFEPIQQIARVFGNIVATQANIERVCGLLDEKPLITDSPEVIAQYGDSLHPKRENWEPLTGDVEFKDVSFMYPDGKEYVLEHFNLKIPAGQTVAIVGETGAGKSTLVNLACRFYEPTDGQILIDGVDYRARSQLWLHSNIGYVLQSPHLFSGTVRDNIRYGKPDATDKEIRSAAHSVSADRVIDKLEKGYDSDVGEGGDRLSTGEKQLISFARAILADPRILVLDEATSSIDTETERLIQDATARLLQNRTTFLIAHRLSTIRKADVILVVREGKIVERGTHAELLAKGGYYRTLYTRQLAEEQTAKSL